MELKLARLPRGTNRNRMQRRQGDGGEEEENSGCVERLFARFWRQWRLQHDGRVSAPDATGGAT